MMGGYRLPIGDDWRVEPSFLLKYTTPVPLKIDVTATIRYKDTFWLGAGFRTNDAYSAMVGYWLKKTFQFGYSYDIITSNLQNAREPELYPPPPVTMPILRAWRRATILR